MTGYVYVLCTVVLTTYGQMIIKWQTREAGEFSGTVGERISYMGNLLTNPWVISSLTAAAIAALCWMAALSTLDLSRAYPFVAASFVLLLVLSAVVFDEEISNLQVLGTLMIVGGLLLATRM